MTAEEPIIEQARRAALDVLHHNARGPRGALPRTAGWGYAEPYTRDWMIAALGILTTGDAVLVDTIRRMLVALAAIQSPHGQIPGLADAPTDRGSRDTTPRFLIGLALYRQVTGERTFLEAAANRARAWMVYQSDDDGYLVAQQPTSDWRDEQWVLGHGLYVNTLVDAYLRL
jgi:glycogen debranching enzyme